MNLQMEAKQASSTVVERSQLNLCWSGQILHVYKQELFCVAISYLQFTEF